jgi:hypothetical protein
LPNTQIAGIAKALLRKAFGIHPKLTGLNQDSFGLKKLENGDRNAF